MLGLRAGEGTGRDGEARAGLGDRGLVAMSSWAVHWHEGMFLSPHHFQAADRHLLRRLREAEEWFQPLAWGLRGVAYDADAVGNYVASLRACEARFKDGTHLCVGPGRDVPPLSLDLREALAESASTTVLLAVPTFQLGRKNVEDAPSSLGPRFWTDEEDCDDENKEAVAMAVRFRRIQAKLIHSGDDPTGYETLPLLRVERSGEAGAAPRVVASYVPPLLSFDAWPWLVDRVGALAHQIQAKLGQLADQVAGRGISLGGSDSGDAERLFKLVALNESLPPLRLLANSPGSTPLAVYVELSRVLGRLGLFLPGRQAPAVAPYDHEDIGGRFAAIIDQIEAALRGVEPTRFAMRYFVRSGERIQVALEEGWLQANCPTYLGIETDLSEGDCDRLLQQLDRSIGSAAQVEALFTRRFPGLILTPLSRVPRDLPARKGIAFFEIGRDPRVWASVASDRSLAIRLNMEQATFQSDEVIRVTTADGRGINLRFALYVVTP